MSLNPSSAMSRYTSLYLGGQAARLVDINWKSAGIFGASFFKGQVMREMVEHHITEDFLQRIAVEQCKGRRLFVVTTDLDTRKAVTWNMGAIANSGRPDALQLFRNVLLASAAIPGIFPAVMIKARSGNAFIE